MKVAGKPWQRSRRTLPALIYSPVCRCGISLQVFNSISDTSEHSKHELNMISQLSFVNHYFGRLFCQFSTQPSPPLIGSFSWQVSGQVSFSTEVPSVMVLVSWQFALTGLPWNVPAVPGLFFCGAPTNLWWHQFPSSYIDDEFNERKIYLNEHLTQQYKCCR